MSALSDLKKILGPDTSRADSYGVVLETSPGGRVLVRSQQRTVSCTTVVPVTVGDTVRLQGSLVVARRLPAPDTLPEYRV